MKATDELKEFSQPKYYEKNSVEWNSILYYAGRVDLGKISFGVAMTDAMLDLSSGSFDVPIVEKYSPIAFSVINQIHCGITPLLSIVELNLQFVLWWTLLTFLAIAILSKPLENNVPVAGTSWSVPSKCRWGLHRNTNSVLHRRTMWRNVTCVGPFWHTQRTIVGPRWKCG